jgi:TM2 domain-containing membrane protein YozV
VVLDAVSRSGYTRKAIKNLNQEGRMRLAIKAALLSGLVFPGLGQIYLKRPVRGIAFIMVTLGSMILLVADLTRQATVALERLAAGGGAIDMTTISDAAARAATDAGSLRTNLLLGLLFGCWLLATVDAYRLGRQKERSAQTAFKPPDPGEPFQSPRH